MNLEEELKRVSDRIEELKGEEMVRLKILEESVDIEGIVIGRGGWVEDVGSMGNNVKIEGKGVNIKMLGIEGSESGDWVLIELGEVVVDIMREKRREF